MLITCITHADARDKKHPFRGLSEQGWQVVDSAAKRFKELSAPLEAERNEKTPTVETIISSPKARCLETAILFAKAINEYCAASEVEVDQSLKAGSITGHELSQLANKVSGRHVLASAHADLARAVPTSVELDASAAKNGRFTTRPVLFLLEYGRREAWESARVLYCEGLIGGKWVGSLHI